MRTRTERAQVFEGKPAADNQNDNLDYTTKNTSAKERFLSLVADVQRSTLTNVFLKEAKRGITAPDALVEAVQDVLRARIGRAGTNKEKSKFTCLLLAVQHRQEDAEGFAAHCVQYANLPEEARRATKARSEEHFRRAYMRQQAPTQKQLDYLRALGHTGRVRNRLRASQLIQKLSGRAK